MDVKERSRGRLVMAGRSLGQFFHLSAVLLASATLHHGLNLGLTITGGNVQMLITSDLIASLVSITSLRFR